MTRGVFRLQDLEQLGHDHVEVGQELLLGHIPATATSSQRAPRELPELPSMTMMMISGALIIQ